MKKYLLVIIVIIMAFGGVLFFNKNSQSPTKNNKLQVTASFYPVYYFSSEIGGDRADVKNITPAGSEPHDFEPSAQDVARIENGDMLVLNGAVEAWGDRMQTNLKGKKVKVIVVSEGLLTKELVENEEKMRDPHIWLDPQLAKEEVQRITEGYVEVDPTNAAYYQDNQRRLAQKLDDLDAKYKAGLSNCKQKDIITSHAAFGYLGERYGLGQVAIAGLSPDSEPSSKKLADVVDFAKQHAVKYIFFESLVSPKLSETIAHELGAKTLVLDPIEGISDDDRKQGKNYFTMMENNLKNLQLALECSN